MAETNNNNTCSNCRNVVKKGYETRHARKCKVCDALICRECKHKLEDEGVAKKLSSKTWAHVKCWDTFLRDSTCTFPGCDTFVLGKMRPCQLCGESYCRIHKKECMKRLESKTWMHSECLALRNTLLQDFEGNNKGGRKMKAKVCHRCEQAFAGHAPKKIECVLCDTSGYCTNSACDVGRRTDKGDVLVRVGGVLLPRYMHMTCKDAYETHKRRGEEKEEEAAAAKIAEEKEEEEEAVPPPVIEDEPATIDTPAKFSDVVASTHDNAHIVDDGDHAKPMVSDPHGTNPHKVSKADMHIERRESFRATANTLDALQTRLSEMENDLHSTEASVLFSSRVSSAASDTEKKVEGGGGGNVDQRSTNTAARSIPSLEKIRSIKTQAKSTGESGRDLFKKACELEEIALKKFEAYKLDLKSARKRSVKLERPGLEDRPKREGPDESFRRSEEVKVSTEDPTPTETKVQQRSTKHARSDGGFTTLCCTRTNPWDP